MASLRANGFGRLPKLGRLPKSKHVRLHCILSARHAQRHTWQSTFGLGGGDRDSSAGSLTAMAPAEGRSMCMLHKNVSTCQVKFCQSAVLLDLLHLLEISWAWVMGFHLMS